MMLELLLSTCRYVVDLIYYVYRYGLMFRFSVILNFLQYSNRDPEVLLRNFRANKKLKK